MALLQLCPNGVGALSRVPVSSQHPRNATQHATTAANHTRRAIQSANATVQKDGAFDALAYGRACIEKQDLKHMIHQWIVKANDNTEDLGHRMLTMELLAAKIYAVSFLFEDADSNHDGCLDRLEFKAAGYLQVAPDPYTTTVARALAAGMPTPMSTHPVTGDSCSFSFISCNQFFRLDDIDHDGYLTLHEMERGNPASRIPGMAKWEAAGLLSVLDNDVDMRLSWSEFHILGWKLASMPADSLKQILVQYV